MVAHGICFDLYYRPKLRQTGQNGLAALTNQVVCVKKELLLSLGKRMDIKHIWATFKLLYFTDLIQDIFQHEKH